MSNNDIMARLFANNQFNVAGQVQPQTPQKQLSSVNTSSSSSNEGNNNNSSSSTTNIPSRMNARQQMNMEVLKRKDKFITTITNTYDHVVLYKYNKSEWEKLDVEGAMFIVERNEPKAPKYRVVVMNRKSATDFHQDITKDLDLEVHHPFVFYKTKNNVRGIWFYKPLQCIEFNDLIVSLKEKAFGKSETVSTSKQQQKQDTSSGNQPITAIPSTMGVMEVIYHQHTNGVNHQASDASPISANHLNGTAESDPSSFLKSMLGIGVGSSQTTIMNGHSSSAAFMDESVMRTEYLNSSQIPEEFTHHLAQSTAQQFANRKLTSKEMFINHLIYTLQEDDEFSNKCYEQYCNIVNEASNKPSILRRP